MQQLKACSKAQLQKLKPWLDKWVKKIEQPSYIEDDPVSFMYAFEDKMDRELAGFFAALLAWGRRDIVLAKTQKLLERMNNKPASFIHQFKDDDANRFEGFRHRTFKPIDIFWIVKCLHKILHLYGSLEVFWSRCYQKSRQEKRELIAVFHHEFFNLYDDIPRRTRKHISNPEKGSACKRLYLYLRWVIRKDSPVDPGFMHFMEPSELMIPLDVHAARQARILGLLTRNYNDWKAVCELTGNLRRLNAVDPVKYDYALFGIGVRKEPIPEEFIINYLGK